MSRYSIQLVWSPPSDGEDSGCWLAYHPEIGFTTCSASGDNKADALRSLDYVRKEVLAYLREVGKPIPEPVTYRLERAPGGKKKAGDP